jgi:predicted acylesterase/phospholipase RssA
LGKDRKLEMHQTELMDASKYTFELVAQALMILPKVVTGKIRSDAFSSKISWLGTHEELKTKPGKLVLVFSGGSAKGVFYSGFVRAFQEAGLWPDFVVGASAGAVAASVLAAGKKGDEFDELFSIRTMKKVFSPLSMPFTFAFSIARGLVGWGFGNHLRKVLGTKTFSDIADLFVVATVQRPVNFGQTVFGRMSETNGNVSLSSNVPVWKAVWGSASMQGIIPQPTIKGLTAERLTNGEFGVKIESIKLPYATLDDGAVVEHLPIVTAELLLKEMNEDALVVAINLMNLNPMRAHMNIPEYHSLREWIALEVSSLGSSQKWYKKPFHAFRGMRKWARQEINRLFYRTAPFRTLGAYDAVSEQNAIRGVETVREKGAKILINPNHDGALDKISLLTFNGYDETKEYGYETGKEVAEMLLGKRITKPYGLP